MTTSAPTPPTMFMSGPMMLRMRASRMLASWKRSLMAANVRISRASAL
jgi:hypothetical protein